MRLATAVLPESKAQAGDGKPVVHAYRFALDPSAQQSRALSRHCGAARVAFNWGLNVVRANLEQRAAERSYGLHDDELTPAVDWSAYALRKAWNRAKYVVAPWWAQCSKEAYSNGLANLAAALNNWKTSRAGKRGGNTGFPHFKSKRRAVPSCRFTVSPIRLEDDRKHITLPMLGKIKTHESTRKLHRRLANGTARIMSATVRQEAGRWYCSFVVEVQRATRVPARPDSVIGIDLGVKVLAVFSDGRPNTENPRFYDTSLRKLTRLSRAVSRKQGPDRSTGFAGSNRWRRANKKRNRVHVGVRRQRIDAIHKLTTGLAREYGSIVIEDLNVAAMVRNRRLARVIADAGYGEIRRQLTYKTQWNGGRLIVADRWFPSSKTCSGCGVVKPKLPLRVRTFHCGPCGLILDRDQNAAHNLVAYAGRHVAGSGPETQNGRGADRKTARSAAGGREASTPRWRKRPGETGTLDQRRSRHGE